MTVQLRMIFKGTILAACGIESDSAEKIVDQGDADLIVFGHHFISNPALRGRNEHGDPLNAYDRTTLSSGDAHGYTDYPFYEQTAV